MIHSANDRDISLSLLRGLNECGYRGGIIWSSNESPIEKIYQQIQYQMNSLKPSSKNETTVHHHKILIFE